MEQLRLFGARVPRDHATTEFEAVKHVHPGEQSGEAAFVLLLLEPSSRGMVPSLVQELKKKLTSSELTV
jgi:hypothetical protein